MRKIKSIIIDDELSAQSVLKTLLQKHNKDIEIIACASSLLEGITLIKEKKPNLVFLDVEMPKHAGYEIVNFFDQIDFKIIFTTAYDHYAIKAFELSAIDYLLKPISREKLNQAIIKAKNIVDNEFMVTSYKTLVNNINHKSKKIMITESGSRKVLDVKNIIAIKGEGAYSIIYLNTGTQYTVSKNLKSFEDIIDLEDGFYRSHKSWIIQLSSVIKYFPSKHEISMKNGIKTRLSKQKKTEFGELLLSKKIHL